MFEQFPYTNFHDLNLDWIIKRVMEAYGPDNPPENVVVSVNGESGEVVLYRDAYIVLPEVEQDTWNISRGADGSAVGIQFRKGHAIQRIDDLGRYDVYDSGNPPPYPVRTVNGQTGNVVIPVPVQSVNGLTGNVILYQNANIVFPGVDSESWSMTRETDTSPAVGIRFSEDGPAKRIDDDNEYDIYDEGNPPPYPVTSVGTLTGAVAILDTEVVTDGGTQKLRIAFPVTSVDGMTGIVKTWANSANAMLKTPAAGEGDAWGLVREVPSGDAGIRFEYSNGALNGYLYFDDGTNPVSKVKILTPADIPSSSGVVSINGLAGVVTLNGSNLDMSGSDTRKIETVVSDNETAIGKHALDMADAYDDTTTYNVGDYCIYSNQLYKCNTAIVVSESFTPAHWTACTIAEEIANNTASIGHIEEGIAIIVSGDVASSAVPVGGYAYIRNNTHGLTEGLYTNTGASTFPTSGGTADSTTFTSASNALSALNDKIRKIKAIKQDITFGSNGQAIIYDSFITPNTAAIANTNVDYHTSNIFSTACETGYCYIYAYSADAQAPASGTRPMTILMINP